MSINDCIVSEKIITVVRGIDRENTLQLASALLTGGLHVMELPLDQTDPGKLENTLETVMQLRQSFGDAMCIGCGTVLTTAQVQQAAHAGAQMIISPDVCPGVIAATRQMGMVSIPGAITPTEIAQADRAGADFVKLFPIQFQSPDYIRALRAPLGHIKMIAMGGIRKDNLRTYLRAGCCAVGIGRALVNPQWIAQGRFDLITQAAACLRGLASAPHNKERDG